MKLLVIFAAAFFTTALARQDVQVTSDNIEEVLGELLKDFTVDLPPEVFQNLELYAENGIENEIGSFSAIVDEYVDQIFDNLRTLLANSSSNSISLPPVSLKLDQNGQLNLTNGVLEDIASLTRDGDVVVDYSTDSNTITLTLPIRFDDIKYSFDYQAKILLITAHGALHGTIKNVKIDAVISFDFNTYQASLDHYDMKDTGEITINFTGNALVDWLIDIISAVVATTLHPLIVDVLQKAISGIISGVIDSINEAIDGFLNPTTESIITSDSFM